MKGDTNMARKARVKSSIGVYYIELKGEKLFFTQADRDKFTETAEEIFADGGKIYGIFLSDTVIRMVVKESAAGISAAMKSLTIVYARYFNKANGLTGKLFTDRFKSIPLDSEAAARRMAKSLDDEPVKPEKKSAPKPKTTSQKPAAKKEEKPKNEPQKEEAKPSPKKKNLPSWLL